MSKVCAICGKGSLKGNQVSHSKRKTIKHSKPNVQKISVDINGKLSKEYVCTKCLKTAKN